MCFPLRDRICAAFEAIEAEAEGPFFPESRGGPGASSAHPGSARIIPAPRAAAASWRMNEGRVFEKVGVSISLPFTANSPQEFRGQIRVSDTDPRFCGLGHFR